MEIPLTPLEFVRRARRLYADREAVVDGELRLTYAQFFERCDRWSSALQRLGVRPGDRVAYIAPNTHAQLESFYAVPQIGAVLVPINYRLTADDFAYIIDHSGARVVCAHSDYLEAVDAIRAAAAEVEHFVALEGAREGWLDYEPSLAARLRRTFDRPEIAETRPADHQLHERHHLAAQGRDDHAPQRLHEHRGHARAPPHDAADRYLWTLPMFHANGWTFVWIVTAVGATHVCLREGRPGRASSKRSKRESVTMLCAAPTVLIGIANAPEELRRGAPPRAARAHGRARPRPPPPSSASRASWAGRSRRSTA